MIGAKEFANLNLMAGTVRSLDQAPGSAEDMQIFNRDFDMLVADMKNLVDPELAADLAAQKDYYTAAFQVAKGAFGGKPFGGLKASTGQFGMRMIMPQDLRTDAAGLTPALYSWLQTLTTTTSRTVKTGAIGYGGSYCYTQNAANKNEVIAFHRLISYKPNPRVLAVELTINGVGYMPWSVEVYSKIRKPYKQFTIIPMPGKVLLHPGGFFYINLFFDLEVATIPTTTNVVDVEIAPFGLTFAEYDYLAAGAIT